VDVVVDLWIKVCGLARIRNFWIRTSLTQLNSHVMINRGLIASYGRLFSIMHWLQGNQDSVSFTLSHIKPHNERVVR